MRSQTASTSAFVECNFIEITMISHDCIRTAWRKQMGSALLPVWALDPRIPVPGKNITGGASGRRLSELCLTGIVPIEKDPLQRFPARMQNFKYGRNPSTIE